MKINRINFFLSAALAVLVFSCNSGYRDLEGPPGQEGQTPPAYKDMDTLGFVPAESRSAPAPSVVAAEPAPSDQGTWQVRKQIRTGSVNLEVPDLGVAEKALGAKVKAAGGFIENSSADTWSRTLVLRIPSDQFDLILGGLELLGKVQNRQVSTQDVTTQFYDLETRIKNQRILLDQYRELLKRTAKLQDLLDVMSRITDLTSQIENLEGQFRYLGRQVDYSTLTVQLTSPALTGGRQWPDLGHGFEDFAFSTVEFFYGLLFILVGLVVFGVPILALGALLVWIFLGKPGLGRKLAALGRGGSPKSDGPAKPDSEG